VNHIRKWLQESGKPFVEDFAVDFLIRKYDSNDWLVHYEGIECKGTRSDFHRAVGQCLDYHFVYDCIPIYLAIPRDYRSLEPLTQIIHSFKLPIGIMLVDESGHISRETEAKGKARYYKEYKGDHGYNTHKPTHPKLHFDSGIK
jgi:hypothetical protein